MDNTDRVVVTAKNPADADKARVTQAVLNKLWADGDYDNLVVELTMASILLHGTNARVEYKPTS